MKDNRSYYDDFSNWYERERHGGYHAMLDELQVEIARPYAENKDVLELGCGTGLILKEIAPIAQRAVGIDISPGMLDQARSRGLEVLEGSVTDLPFDDQSFDFIYSFKVLAHVEQIDVAMNEVSRVLKPGGFAALEFYNKRSIRALIKKMKRPHAVSEQTTDEEVFTRYDDIDEVRSYLPESLEVVDLKGVRVFTPFAQIHKVPVINRILYTAERYARDSQFLKGFGGFMVVIVERKS